MFICDHGGIRGGVHRRQHLVECDGVDLRQHLVEYGAAVECTSVVEHGGARCCSLLWSMVAQDVRLRLHLHIVTFSTAPVMSRRSTAAASASSGVFSIFDRLSADVHLRVD